MIKKKLLILYTKNPDEVYNRKSAIGSYVNCLAGLLSEDFDVTINYQDIDHTPVISALSTNTTSKFGLIKKFIPKKIKSYLIDKKHFAHLEDLKQKIISTSIKFDVILEFYNYGSDLGLELSEFYKCPLNLIYDGPIFEEYEFFNGHKSPFEKKCRNIEKMSFEKASKIVVYSQPMVDFCLNNIHNIPEKYHIHQNIDFSRFHFFEGEKDISGTINICFVGSFLKWHRVDLLLRAYKKLLDQNLIIKTHLYLIGDGVEKNKMQLLALELELKNHVTFTGFKDGAELIELQKKMHIGVMPSSNWYGAPNKIFEYGAMKMACFAPKTKTIQSLFSPDEIAFFDNNDELSLNKTLEKLCVSDSEISSKALALSRKIRTEHSIAKTRDFYHSILNKV